MTAERGEERKAGRPMPHYRIKEMPELLRPREEMARVGAENASERVLLSVLLRNGIRGLNVMDLAESLLNEYGSLTALAAASVEDLASHAGVGRVKALTLKAALELARRLAQEKRGSAYAVRTPEDAVRVLRETSQPLREERFWALFLDAKNRLQGQPHEVTKGILDASLIHPREVFRAAVERGSAAVVVVHNHPSGDPTPSAEDVRVTRQLVQAGRVVGIKVLDHVVLGSRTNDSGADYVSLREAGLADFGEETNA